MKRNEKMLQKVFEAERSKSLKRAAELETSNKKVCLVQNKAEVIEDNILAREILIDEEVQVTVEECAESRDSNSTPTFNIINYSAETAATPLAPLFSPITPIDRNTFLSGNNITIPESSENSSPVRTMSPDTQQLFDTMAKAILSDFIDDDSVKDPDYTVNEDLNTSFSDDECTSHTVIETALVHTTKLNGPKHFSSVSTRQPKISHDNASMSLDEIDDNNKIISKPEKKSGNNCQTRRIQVNVPGPTKRRCSENDLQQYNQTQQPSKKLIRSASVSDVGFSQQTKANKPISPKKRRVADPTKWKRRIERDKRLKGEAYKTVKGKLMSAAPLKQPKCLENPKHKCNESVPEDAWKKIYESFRALGSLDAQRQFIIQHVTKDKKKRSTTSGRSRKESTHHYHFTIRNEKVTVCRVFFLNTLNIKEGIVRGALKKVSPEGVVMPENRGKKCPPNKLAPEQLDMLKTHILSFPAMESHYCRKNSEYKYLDAGLNVQIMYSLYKKKCEEEGTIPAGMETYRKVFRSYKLRFHVPKKDLCKKCVAFKDTKSNATILEDANHSKHLKRRDDAFLRRDADKAAANNNKNVLAFNFDLQAVLHTPKGAAGPFFYVRKLPVYNLTCYRFGDKDVDCFTWDETEGKRGSIEIATCIYKYISDKQDITHVRMMSDNCGGQQKNFHFSCMLLHLVTTHPTIHTIDHVFYEPGHSHMECDSVHSKIEQKCKNTAVYTPDGWLQVMRLARRNPRPFNVTVLSHGEFLDFNPNNCHFAAETTKKTQSKKCKEKETWNTTNKKKINFQDAVWIQYLKNSSKSIFIKTDYNEESFKEMKIKAKKGKNTSLMPTHVYSSRLPISTAKKRDLMKLCAENQIPKYYHSFYENLPVSSTVQDRLPEPDAEEVD
ncbi:unnamed protein product [Pieris macdunnoughi]|uniref:DUF7869 domain-containing protein n=1 Tax=Pieris macdunnoughi TaxID=345717 RepID=A0A821QU65_9NEOP|nr:unnamed protein product [Pieris macdunnoughi]